MGFTQATINAMVDAICNATPFAVTTVTVSLHNGDPGASGDNELAGGSYGRQVLTCGSASSGGQIANTAALNYTDMPADTVSHIGMWDGSTFRGGAALTAPQSVSAGQTFSIAIGQLVANLNQVGQKLSTYARNKLLDAFFRNVSFSVATPYGSLHTADPGDTGANPVAGGSYVRKLVNFGAAASGQAANDTLVRYDGMPATTATHGGLWDAATSGNFLAGNALAASKTFGAGDAAEFDVGTITVG